MRSEVQVLPDPPDSHGGVAQLGERLPCKQEVIGSNPFTSTIILVGFRDHRKPMSILFSFFDNCIEFFIDAQKFRHVRVSVAIPKQTVVKTFLWSSY